MNSVANAPDIGAVISEGMSDVLYSIKRDQGEHFDKKTYRVGVAVWVGDPDMWLHCSTVVPL